MRPAASHWTPPAGSYRTEASCTKQDRQFSARTEAADAADAPGSQTLKVMRFDGAFCQDFEAVKEGKAW